MALYRTFQTNFWQDNFILDLEPEEKLLYMYLCTNSHTTLCGIYAVSIKLIAFETGLEKSAVEKGLKLFQEKGKIAVSERTGEICLRNWLKNNVIAGDKCLKALINSLEEVSDKNLIPYLSGIEKYVKIPNTLSIPHSSEELNKNTLSESDSQEKNTLCIGYAYPMHRVSAETETVLETESVTETVTETGEREERAREDPPSRSSDSGMTKASAIAKRFKPTLVSTASGFRETEPPPPERRKVDVEFKILWEAYPKKINHDRGYYIYAEKAFRGSLPPLKELLEAVEKQSRTQQWQDINFVPSLSRWLEDRRWLDVVPEEAEAEEERQKAALEDNYARLEAERQKTMAMLGLSSPREGVE